MARRWFCAKSSLSHWGWLDRRHSILMLKPLFRREATEESLVSWTSGGAGWNRV